MKRALNSALAAGVLLLSGGALARDYYVATNGTDAGYTSGGYNSPFRTFTNAMARLNPGDTLLIFGGVYTQRLVINRSGSASDPIRIMRATSDAVTINCNGQSGSGILVTGSNVWLEGIEVCYCDPMGGRDPRGEGYLPGDGCTSYLVARDLY